MRQSRITMTPEIALQNPPVFRAVEHRAPSLKLPDPRRSLFRMQLRHAWIIQILSSAHGIGEMDAPAIAVVDIAHRRRHPTLGHNGMSLAEQRFRNHANPDTSRRSLNSS